MRRGLTIAIVVTAMLGMTVPAGAKGKPRPTEYRVTMSSGLATTCNEPGQAIVMTGNINSVLRADGVMLGMQVPIEWWRDFDAGWGAPTATDPSPDFSGCHGLSQSATDTESFPGALWLTFGNDASGNSTVTFRWRFDYYWQFRQETRGKNKTVQVQEVLELFELESEELLWNDDGTVSGPFSVALFTKTETDGITHNWDPMGTADLTVNLTITPIG